MKITKSCKFNSSAIKEAPLFPLDMPFDPGFEEPNLVEEKHNIQVRSLRDTRKHYHLKPTSRIRTKIETILKRFPTNKTLAQSENDILWTYRYSLIDKPEALAKFLLSVDWSIQEEVDEVS
uniref:Phosphatidylinositol 3-kinase catalytic subunit type 3 (Trinotate prediction) n=1 Tax=Myxobolus squamalis TaxID=59785 RepID=A0A6B2FX52_MYXSQ